MKLIVGCGYLGLRVARRWIAAGEAVAGVVRGEGSAEALAAAGARPIVADVTRPASLRDLPAADTLLYCVGHSVDGGASRWAVYVDGLRAALDAVSPEVQRVIFISSTGVYGEESGGWVDEDSPCGPLSDSGRALLAAEQVLAAHRLGNRGIILRLAGIYGPGRLPLLKQGAGSRGHGAALPAPCAADQYANLIHVEDAAAAVLAAEARAQPPRTYIVADGRPVQRREFLAEIARRLGLPAPVFRDPLPGEAAKQRGGNKRTCNRRMLEELQVELQFPTYREGLESILPAAGRR